MYALEKKMYEFINTKKLKPSSEKDYKVDCRNFIRWYQKHSDIPADYVYDYYMQCLENTKYTITTKERKKKVVGEFLVFLGIYSRSHIIIQNNKTKRIRYYSTLEYSTYFEGKKIENCDDANALGDFQKIRHLAEYGRTKSERDLAKAIYFKLIQLNLI